MIYPQVSLSASSEAGQKKQNQDSLLLQSVFPSPTTPLTQQETWLLTGVADGVSACKNPKLASSEAVNRFQHQLTQHYDSTEIPLGQAIAQSMQRANDALYFYTAPNATEQHFAELLSTFSGLVITPKEAHLFHTGDSRVYLFSPSQTTDSLEVLTQDHRHHKGRDKGALSAALGADTRVESHYQSIVLTAGSIFLMMTDGVYEYLDNDEILALLRALQKTIPMDINTIDARTKNPIFFEQLDQLPNQLCQAAIENGSNDNVSCIALVVHQSQAAETNTATTLKLRIPPALNVGDSLDDLTITQVIYHTARSSVYLTQDGLKNQRVIKAPSQYFEDDPNYLRQFLNEEKVGLSFNHGSLLKFYPRPITSPYLYHRTEFVSGTNLRDFLNEHGPLDLIQAHELISRIGLALRVMHRNYYLHQDIKPENIMLDGAGNIKLIDFGSTGSLLLKNALQPPAGDLHYTAPEYYSQEPKGIYSDLFSLAVISYEMLTGKLPFSTKSLSFAHRTGAKLEFTNLKSINPALPYWINDVFIRALHPEPNSRFAAIGEFLSELDPKRHEPVMDHQPLIKRNPVLLWQIISGVLAAILVVVLLK